MKATEDVRARAERIRSISWTQSMDHIYSRVLLMREYLRRAALVVGDEQPAGWPFADLAAVVTPAVRADPVLVAEVARVVRDAGQFTPIPDTCVAALHWARLAADRELPWPDPFEPLLLMYERGGGFTFNDAGMIEVDLVGVPRRKPVDYLSATPIGSLDAAFLAEADAEFERKLRAKRAPAAPAAPAFTRTDGRLVVELRGVLDQSGLDTVRSVLRLSPRGDLARVRAAEFGDRVLADGAGELTFWRNSAELWSITLDYRAGLAESELAAIDSDIERATAATGLAVVSQRRFTPQS